MYGQRLTRNASSWLLLAALSLTVAGWPQSSSAANRQVYCQIMGVKDEGGSPTALDPKVILHNSTGRTIAGRWRVRWLLSDGRSGWFNGNRTVRPGRWLRTFYLSQFNYPWCKDRRCSNLGLQCKAVVYFNHLNRVPGAGIRPPASVNPRVAPRIRRQIDRLRRRTN